MNSSQRRRRVLLDERLYYVLFAEGQTYASSVLRRRHVSDIAIDHRRLDDRRRITNVRARGKYRSTINDFLRGGGIEIPQNTRRRRRARLV